MVLLARFSILSLFIFSSFAFSVGIRDIEGVWKGSCQIQGSEQYTSLTFFIFKNDFGSYEQDFCSDSSCVDPAFVAGFSGSRLSINASTPRSLTLGINAPNYLVLTPLTASSVALLDKEFENAYNVTGNFKLDYPSKFDARHQLHIAKKEISIRIINSDTIELGDVTNIFENGSQQVFGQLNGCRLSI